LNFLDMFSKNTHTKFNKNPSGGAVLFYTDGRTDGQTDRQIDITKLVIILSNFANAPKTDEYLITSSLILSYVRSVVSSKANSPYSAI
jgi:hypothetical protein